MLQKSYLGHTAPPQGLVVGHIHGTDINCSSFSFMCLLCVWYMKRVVLVEAQGPIIAAIFLEAPRGDEKLLL